ncbi:MAG: radical SAM superfamily enzyme YgiQ (UPF0313 family) [Polyangiales bacterium]|jgi:radical SAM superfamily enzyme YgiQ (UPF0313 family)
MTVVRVAFVAANREILPDAVIPFGLLNVMSAVPARHERWLVDVCFEEDPLRYVRSALGERPADLIAVGLRNIQNNDYDGIRDNLGWYEELFTAIRETTDAPIVVGGGAFSVMPEGMMSRLRPDYGISGEGEQPLPLLLQAIEAGEGFDDVPNLYRWNGGELVHHGHVQAFVDMNATPIVDRSVVKARYYEEHGIDSVQTKRGCNLRCSYCTYPVVEGRVSRRREPALVADEFEAVQEQHPNVKHIFIVDSVFNLPPKHAKDVCRELIARDNKLPWTCYANPLRFDDELAQLMVAAGCAGVEVGTDSGCDEVLFRLKKGFDTNRVRQLRASCERAGLPDCHNFILGTPGETLDDVKRTLDFIVDIDPFSALLVCWVDDDEALDPVLRVERQRLREGVHEVMLEHKDLYPRWVMPALGVNFSTRLFRALRRNGLHGPLWQYADNIPGGARKRKKMPPAPRMLPMFEES